MKMILSVRNTANTSSEPRFVNATAFSGSNVGMGIRSSSFRYRGITDTEIHFHFFPIVNVK
jgi:hypothetical protein